MQHEIGADRWIRPFFSHRYDGSTLRSEHRLGFIINLVRQIIVCNGAPTRPLEIIELPGPHGPEASEKAAATERQSHGQENDQNVHDANSRAPRALSAFSVTRIDEPDMANAATSGEA